MTFENNKKLMVVNMFAGPSVGKSTTAAAVFHELKKASVKVELVHEFAKQMVWNCRSDIFTEQDYLFAHQHRLIRQLVQHDIDVAIVDSSLLLSLVYRPDWYPNSFDQFVLDVFRTYNNVNIFIERNPEFDYVQAGRNESYEQAIQVDQTIRNMLICNNIPFHSIQSGQDCVSDIIRHLYDKHAESLFS